MSIIVWDGKLLAADTGGIMSGTEVESRKLHVVEKTQHVYGGTGTLSEVSGLQYWHEQGADMEKWPAWQKEDSNGNSSHLIVAHNGILVEYEALPHPIPVEPPFCAWGSGANYAFGALHMGADAIQAAQAAVAMNIYCNGNVRWVNLETLEEGVLSG